jgi:hypothetical protein
MAMRPLIDQAVGAIRATAAIRWKTAARLRADTRAALARQRATRRAMARSVRQALQQRRSAAVASLRATLRPVIASPLWDLWPGSGERHVPDERLQTQVLRIIQAHPEGVAAVDVGNELGLDWRRVLGIGRTLAEGGQVEQAEHEFFPIGKASRRW